MSHPRFFIMLVALIAALVTGAQQPTPVPDALFDEVESITLWGIPEDS